MGCAASAPQDVDTLPIKSHCRTAFSQCSTSELNGQAAENYLSPQTEEGHDVVLCYPLGGTVFGLELQARYEKMDSLSLWTLNHVLSAPGSPACVSKSASDATRNGGLADPAVEIKPVPEGAGAFAPSYVALCREVRMCRRGVVVLVTAGCTWDDGVLTCLRLAGKFLRPLVMVHCVQSCPLPALEEWPQDVRPFITAWGPPIKYCTQHSAEALRDVEQRMLRAAEASVKGTAVAVEAGANQDTQQGHGQQQPEGLSQHEQSQQQQQQGATKQVIVHQGAVQRHGKEMHGTLPSEPPLPLQQQEQPAAVMISDCGCLDKDLWFPPRKQQQQTPSQHAHLHRVEIAPTSNATKGSSPRPVISAARSGSAPISPLTDTEPDLGPLSLTAVLASNSDICRRASQLLGLWTCSGAQPCEVPPAAGPYGASNNMPMEALISHNGMPKRKSAAAVGAAAAGAAIGAQPQDQQERSRQHADAQAAQRAGGGAGGGGCKGGTRYVLRYRDPGWATPVAFVCAQLEAEMGRALVSIQVAASRPTRQPAPAPAAGAYVRVSLQWMDSGGHWSQTWRRQAQQQQQQVQQQQQQGSVSAAVSAAVAAAAAAALRGCQRGSSSRSCSVSGGGGGSARLSESTSHHTSSAVSPAVACIDDDLDAYATAPADDCTTPLLAATSVSSSTRSAAPAAQPPPLAAVQSVSWTEEDRESAPDDDAGGGGVACLVYFMTPGLSAPLGCLTELGTGLAAGRRVLLVVDGECCQRLPDYAPAGTTPEVWKAVKRVWQERLLYVSDYHMPFCALLKQGIVAAGPQC